jgi:hypothetical protein
MDNIGSLSYSKISILSEYIEWAHLATPRDARIAYGHDDHENMNAV